MVQTSAIFCGWSYMCVYYSENKYRKCLNGWDNDVTSERAAVPGKHDHAHWPAWAVCVGVVSS